MHKSIFFDFVRIQQILLNRFKAIHPNSINNKWLIGIPAKTEIQYENELWVGVKHGAGICFIRSEPLPQLVVDAHDLLGDDECIDVLRLQQFINSTGVEITFEKTEEALRVAIHDGILAGTPACAHLIE